MKWYDKLYRLQFIVRYSNIPRIRDENVAQHSFFVTSLCLEIMEGLPLGYDIDREKVLTMAIIHDWPESDVDDVAHDVKKKYPSIRNALKKAEVESMKFYPERLRNIFEEYEEGETLESLIVHLADSQQCVQYLESEIKLGNSFMVPLLDESLEYVGIIRNKIDNYYQNNSD